MQNNQNNTPLTEEEEQAQLIEQAQIRREKLAKLTAEGKNPYEKTKYGVTANSQSVKDGFATLEGKEVSIAGSLMSPHYGKGKLLPR